MHRPSPRRRLLHMGALLLGGTLLLLPTGCRGKKGIVSVFPDRVADGKSDGKNPEIRIEDPAASADSSVPPANAWAPADDSPIDPVTGLARERSAGTETAPAGTPDTDLPPVSFGFDSDKLDEAARAALLKHAKYLKDHPNLKVVLRGHTDAQGTDEYNLALGSRRAMTVREFLIAQGIAADRLETVSFGEFLPLQDGEDDAVNAQNRRVEFFVFEKE